MTDRKQALEALLENVESGVARSAIEEAALKIWRSGIPGSPSWVVAGTIAAAHGGSLDAAKELHEAVLPGWRWETGTNLAGDPVAQVWDNGNRSIGRSPEPARSWLIAILEALIAKECDQ